jgi:hypothetical protein
VWDGIAVVASLPYKPATMRRPASILAAALTLPALGCRTVADTVGGAVNGTANAAYAVGNFFDSRTQMDKDRERMDRLAVDPGIERDR